MSELTTVSAASSEEYFVQHVTQTKVEKKMALLIICEDLRQMKRP